MKIHLIVLLKKIIKNYEIEENGKKENLLNLRENYFLISSHLERNTIKIWIIPDIFYYIILKQ